MGKADGLRAFAQRVAAGAPREYHVDTAAVESAAARALPAEPEQPVAALADTLWFQILGGLARGMTLPQACRMEGVEPRHVSNILRTRPDLKMQVQQARLGLLKEMLGVVTTAARDGEYRAAQWMIARLDPPKTTKAAAPKGPTLTMAQVEAIKAKRLEDLAS